MAEPFMKLSSSQRAVLSVMADRGYWSPGCGWNARKATVAALYNRGLLVTWRSDGTPEIERYRLSQLGFLWLIHELLLDLVLLDPRSTAYGKLMDRVTQLSLIAALSAEGPVPLNWRAQEVSVA